MEKLRPKNSLQEKNVYQKSVKKWSVISLKNSNQFTQKNLSLIRKVFYF